MGGESTDPETHRITALAVECGRVTSSVVARRCMILDKGRDCV
jgi:hypothetical protein